MTKTSIWQVTENADTSLPTCPVNSHIHLPPNFSAFETVDQAVSLAEEQNMGIIGISNYYDYDVYNTFSDQAKAKNIYALYGTEIICRDEQMAVEGLKVNDPGNPGKIYFCGKGIIHFNNLSQKGVALLNKIRSNDSTRMATMTSRVAAVLMERGIALPLDEEIVIDMIKERHGSPRETIYIQERHICQAFQQGLWKQYPDDEARLTALEKIFGKDHGLSLDNPVAIQNKLRSELMKSGKPAFVEETFVTLDEAKELILELGGIPCYPTLADGVSPITPFEGPVSEFIENLKKNNIHCAEFIPLRNDPAVLEEYIPALRAAGILITAGTEHNTLDLDPLTPFCKGGAPIPEKVQEIFMEGACVVAAHQALVANGEVGYVTDKGELNPDYCCTNSRIKAFAALGAVLIKQAQKA